MQAVVKVAPALAAGCAVLLKPSPLASLSCLQLEAIATEAGLPHPYPDPDPDPNPNPNPTRTRTRTLTLARTLTRTRTLTLTEAGLPRGALAVVTGGPPGGGADGAAALVRAAHPRPARPDGL